MNDTLYSPATLVSVVIPTYNMGILVQEAVQSVLSQSHQQIEVIVVDDGSTDGCVDPLKGVDDPRLRILTQPNGGLSRARNSGMRSATGDVIAFLDADDIWYPEKVEETLPQLTTHLAAGTRMTYMSEDGRRAPASTGQSPLPLQALRSIQSATLMPFPISSVLFRRSAVEEAGPFDEQLPQAEDIEFLSRVARRGSIGFVDRPLGAYRLRTSSMSAAKQAEQRLVWRFVVQRLAARDAGGDIDLTTFRANYVVARGSRRLDRAAALYREGGLRLSNRRRSGVLLLIAALISSPSYVTKRLKRQIGR